MDKIIINDREYSVVCNWRACTLFLSKKGTDTMAALSDIAKLAPSDCALLAWCCICEGERIAGREVDLQPDFIELMPMTDALAVISAFVTIYAKQSRPKITVRSESKKE